MAREGMIPHHEFFNAENLQRLRANAAATRWYRPVTGTEATHKTSERREMSAQAQPIKLPAPAAILEDECS